MPLKTLIIECIKRVNDYLEQETTPLTNRRLLKLCEPLGEIQKGTVILTCPTKLLKQQSISSGKLARELLTAPDPRKAYVNILKPLTPRLPTQTWRSPEQIKRQQFSTPAGLAYLLNLNADDEAIEPSSGKGSLAVWTSGLRIKTHTNEIKIPVCSRRFQTTFRLGK